MRMCHELNAGHIVHFGGFTTITPAPSDYDFGVASNYSFATSITCGNDDARKMFAQAFGHMLNFNHEEAIACYAKCAELDPNRETFNRNFATLVYPVFRLTPARK